jgi:hypothetical protein
MIHAAGVANTKQIKPLATFLSVVKGTQCVLPYKYKSQSTHRVATAAFWRKFYHDGKISPGW